jgi:hypothetical protein
MHCANTRTTRNYGILESLPSGGSLDRHVPILTLHGINGESAGNYHLMNEEYTRGRGFLRELPAYICGSRPVRSKFAESPSNGNQFQDQQLQILYTDNANFLKNLKMKTSIKFKINLIRYRTIPLMLIGS